MRKRVGELQWLDGIDATQASSGSGKNNGAWVRGIYKNSEFRSGNRASAALTGTEFGYDFKLTNKHDDKTFLGFMGYAAKSDTEFNSMGLHGDKNDLNAYGLGAYYIWLNEDGWFTDVAFRLHFINQAATIWPAGAAAPTTFYTNHMAASLNLEYGTEYILCDLFTKCLHQNLKGPQDFVWFLTPHIQLTGAYVSGADFKNSNGFSGKLNGGFNASASMGANGGPRWTFASGARFQVYGKAGLIADVSESAAAEFEGVMMSDDFNASGLEVGGGMNFRSGDTRSMAYLDATMRFGFDYDEFAGVFGLRYEF
jgi:outer membrane autotransporter protein